MNPLFDNILNSHLACRECGELPCVCGKDMMEEQEFYNDMWEEQCQQNGSSVPIKSK
jgi:hypothetical protein